RRASQTEAARRLVRPVYSTPALHKPQYERKLPFELWDPTVWLCGPCPEHLRDALYDTNRAGCRLRTSSEDVNRSGRSRSLKASPLFQKAERRKKGEHYEDYDEIGNNY